MHKIDTVYIKINDNLDDNILEISSRLALNYGLFEKQKITFKLGRLKEEFYLSLIETDEDMLVLNSVNLKKLALYPEQNYNFKINEGEIRIGPVIGIMVDIVKNRNKPFGAQTLFIKQALEIARKSGQLCFAFSPYNVDWKHKKIQGYTYLKNNWVKSVFPFPDVIYPRSRISSTEKLRIRKRFKQTGVILLNYKLLDKWEAYKILAQNPALESHLPDTRFVFDFTRQIDIMLNKYEAVYLKPICGEQGKNIIKVIKPKKKGIYEYYYSCDKRQFKGKATSINELYFSLKNVIGNRRYIVQERIKLIKWQNKIVDVRVLVQKGYGNRWEITGIACRIGNNGSITSNLSSGGTAKRLEDILKLYFNNQKMEQILSKIKFVSLKSAETLENKIGICAEMGIDLGIDRQGKVWFIEANLRPARKIFTLIGETETRLKSIENPLLYAKYLAGF
ncbi:YheC/YheD family protein [Thermosyntropha sp.]|uniref:YheC/YheD family endospore coat-associated protein n=1 Tax=Thermosyntropha sp. TaxID=2740820 RepID=UPI0025E08A08|nr:YheC/YheD family protein [Thermosyntropha sp.]MBO8158427.1 YheC/YheD family protein [Thermosyntropha sp.]